MLNRQCGGLCICMKENCTLYFVFYGHKLFKVNFKNTIVSKKSCFRCKIWLQLDSPHMVSHYLLIYSKAVKAIIKEI